jgi:hypothetical protein
MLHQTGSGWEHSIWRNGTQENAVDLLGFGASVLERNFRGFDSHVGCRHLGRGDVPLTDAGSLKDPLVVCIDHFGKIVVREQIGRGVAANGSYLRFGQ